MDGPSAPGFGLPTSVGELPFDDHDTAVEFMLEMQPTFPTVPRLRSLGESLIQQIASFLPDAVVSESDAAEGAEILLLPTAMLPDGPNTLDTTALENLSGPFAGVKGFISCARRYGLASSNDVAGVRIDFLGPISTALELRSAGIDLERSIELGIEIASITGRSLLGSLRAEIGSKTIAVVMAEPGLIGAMHPTFPLLSGQVFDALVSVIDAIDTDRGAGELLIGAHVPGRTDWATVISSGVSMVSVPITSNLEGATGHVQAFLDAGGLISWGAVPVDEPLGSTDEILWRRLSTSWCSLVGTGLDPFQLRSQSLVSVADGLSHFEQRQMSRLADLVNSLATRVRRQAAGTRLSLGA